MIKAFNVVLVLNVLAIASAIFIDIFEFGKPFKEGGFITFFSAVQLLIVAKLSYTIYSERDKPKSGAILQKPHLIWLLIAIGFLFLAFDESLKIHERIDRLIHYIFNIQETGVTDRIDDLLVGLYGLIGLATLFIYKSEIKECKAQLSFFVIGFALLFMMVGLDVITNRKDIVLLFFANNFATVLHTWLSFAEEAAKLLSEAFFISGFYAIFKKLQDQRLNTH